LATVVLTRRKRIASDNVDPGKVTAQRAAIHMSQWTYICNAMKGSNNPFAVKNKRTTRSRPPPMKTLAAKRVDTLIKLYPRISTEYKNESKGTNRNGSMP
jgi:hypothetical protein